MKQFKRDLNQKSTKLHLDKYYTPDNIARYCIHITNEILRNKEITETIEPSAGKGSFSKKIKNCIAYDIEPEDKNIIKQDFLELNIPYKKGRLFIGNPPYGARLNLARKFYDKCSELGDYIAFILPISQLDNKQFLYKFDLIYSEDLGIKDYSNVKIHCCFNIYERPQAGLNKRKSYKNSEFIEIREIQTTIRSKTSKKRGSVEDFDYNIAICGWGESIGKEIEYESQYSREFYIKIKDKDKKEEILKLIKNADWKKIYPMTSTPNLCLWQIYKYIEDNIN